MGPVGLTRVPWLVGSDTSSTSRSSESLTLGEAERTSSSESSKNSSGIELDSKPQEITLQEGFYRLLELSSASSALAPRRVRFCPD